MSAPVSDTRTNAGLGPISVVVCNYEGERYLDECLQAVARLRGDVGEVIVVDNASRDRSRELVRELHPEVRVVALERNNGPCAARNAGLEAARFPFVLALDNDCVVGEDTLEKLARAMRDDVALVQPRSVFDSDPTRVHYDGGALHYCGLIALRNFYEPLATAKGEGVVAVDCVIAVALLCRRDALLAAGGWDADFFILFEDLDLSWRLRARGWAILSVEDALVRHKGGTVGISFRDGPSYPARRVYLHARNRPLVLAKNMAPWTLVVALPGLALYTLAGFAFACAQGAPLAFLRGEIDLVRLLPRALRANRALQRVRRLSDRELLVGGPLTLTPAVHAGARKDHARRALDLCLRAWWRCARVLLPRGRAARGAAGERACARCP